MADWTKEEVRRELHTLQQANAISHEAYQHCIQVLDQDWGPSKNPVGTVGGDPNSIFVNLDNHLRELCQQKQLGEGALGSIYITISQERAGKPVVGTPVPPAPAAMPRDAPKPHKDFHLGQKGKNAGKLVMGWAGRGFGFTLGADAANSLWHSVF